MLKKINSVYVFGAIILLFGGIYGQNRFEGYSVVVEANNAGACPVWYLPAVNNGNAIDVLIAGTDQRMPASNLTACDGSSVRNGNKIFPNPNGHWCFSGPEQFYDVKFLNGAEYLWYPVTKDTGFYNVKDFRQIGRAHV